jgi:leader peptidase (prepilin peptidase)/N-methyltransferase
VEFLTGLLSLAFMARFGPSVPYLLFFAFGSAIFLASLIDLDHQIIPDEITLPGTVIGWAFSFWNPLTSPVDSFVGALCGAGGLYLMAEFYYFLTKREGLGGGDLKLLAMIGAFLGAKSLIPVIFFSSLVGALTGILLAVVQKVKDKRTLALPFGPFLSLGALIYLFWPRLLPLLIPFLSP